MKSLRAMLKNKTKHVNKNQSTYIDNVLIGSTFVRVAILCVLKEYFVHVCTGVLEELVSAAEHDQGNFTIAEDAQLVGLLHQTEFAFREGDLRITKNYHLIIIIINCIKFL